MLFPSLRSPWGDTPRKLFLVPIQTCYPIAPVISSLTPHPSPLDPTPDQLAEIPLFTINKVLLPGVDFPLQIDKRNFGDPTPYTLHPRSKTVTVKNTLSCY